MGDPVRTQHRVGGTVAGAHGTTKAGRLLPLTMITVVLGIIAAVALVIRIIDNGNGAEAQQVAVPLRTATTVVTAPSTAAPTSTSAAARTTPAVPKHAVPTPARTSHPTKVPAARPPLTYTVLKGDNLFVIAAWFHLHGYGNLYEQNKSIIGDDPNLIYPGQKITISSQGATVHK